MQMDHRVLPILVIFLIFGLSFAEIHFKFMKDDESELTFDVKSTTTIHHIDETTARSLSTLAKTSKMKKAPVQLQLHNLVSVRRLIKKDQDELYEISMHTCQPIKCNASHYLFTRSADCITEIHTNTSRTKRSWDAALSFIFFVQNQQKFKNLDYEISFKNERESVQRTIYINRLGRQESIMPLFDNPLHYKQTSKYSLKNSVIRRIDAEDHLSIGAENIKALDIHIVTTVEPIKNQMRSKDKIPCSTTKDLDACIALTKNDFGYDKIIASVESHFGSLIGMDTDRDSRQKESRRCTIVSKKNLKLISEYVGPESNRLFLKTINRIERSSDSDVQSCLELFVDSEYAHSLMNILAMSGHYSVYSIVKDFVRNKKEGMWNRYLAVLPHASSIEKPIIEDLMKILADSNVDKPDLTLLSSAASILKRGRHLFQKRNEMEEYRNFIGIFLDKLKNCRDESCRSSWLNSLENAPVPELITFIERKLCSEFGHEDALLKILRLMKLESSHKLSLQQKLRYIYSNLCPKSQSQSARIIAAQLLLQLTPIKDLERQVLNMIHSIKENTSSGREILSSLLSMIKGQAINNPDFKTILTGLRKKRYYNSFLTLFSYGQSASYQRSVDIFGIFEPYYNLEIEFGGGLLKRAEAQLGLSMSDQMSTVAGFSLFSGGSSTIMNLVGSSQSSSSGEDSKLGSSDDHDSNDDQTLTAGLKFRFFDHADAPIILFKGETELMGAVWAAGGEPTVLFNETFLLNDFRLNLPAANGFLLKVDLKSALGLKIDGSVEISLWYRNLKAALNARGNFVAMGHLSVSSGNDGLSKLDFDLFSAFGSDIFTEVDFYASPSKSCFQIGQIPSDFKLTIDAGSKFLEKFGSFNRTFTRQLDGHCANIGTRISSACSTMYD